MDFLHSFEGDGSAFLACETFRKELITEWRNFKSGLSNQEVGSFTSVLFVFAKHRRSVLGSQSLSDLWSNWVKDGKMPPVLMHRLVTELIGTSSASWRNTSLLPTASELSELFEATPIASDPNGRADQGFLADHILHRLPSVPIGKGFSSAHEYFDTYMSLLRADCYGSLEEHLWQVRRNQLPKDLSMYVFKQLVDVTFLNKGSALCFALHVDRVKGRRNVAPQGGNLLGIVLDGDFRNVVWCSVSMLQDATAKALWAKKILLINFVGNDASEAKLMFALSRAKSALIIESPSFFPAYLPVLQALQRQDEHSFPFIQELVFGVSSADIANGTGRLSYSNRKNIHHRYFPVRIPGNTRGLPAYIPQCFSRSSIEKLLSRDTTLDESQTRAVLLALSQRVAIIQGPPGTGKSFIGVKILNLVLEGLQSAHNEDVLAASENNDDDSDEEPSGPGPVLVLSFKNHILDEMVLDILKTDVATEDQVCRLGGGSKDDTVKGLTLREKVAHSKDYSLLDEIVEAEKQIHEDSTLLLKRSSKAVRLMVKFAFPHQVASIVPKEHAERVSEYVSKVQQSTTNNWKDPSFHSELKIVEKALQKWLPDDDVFQTYVQAIGLDETDYENVNNEDEKKSSTGSDSANPEEDAEVKEREKEQENRRAAFGFDNQRGAAEMAKKLKDLQIRPPAWSKKKLIVEDVGSDGSGASASVVMWAGVKDISALADMKKIRFVQWLFQNSKSRLTENLETQLEQLNTLREEYHALRRENQVAVLKSQKVIAATTTGACAHASLLADVGISVVLVEEAAEIVEPHILACLGKSVKQLIMIGDHKQLRPSVEYYPLEMQRNYDKSMFERLINLNHPHESLHMQNRCLEELAEVLKVPEFYPQLLSNPKTVSTIEPIPSVTSPQNFWSHRGTESSVSGGTGYTNETELRMVGILWMWLYQTGVEPSKITVLGAYKAQTALLSKMLSKCQDEKEVKADERTIVMSVDNSQGDENDVVIVSLVRTTPGQVGFVKNPNRLCVALSRARKLRVFIGSEVAFSSKAGKAWQSVMNHFHEKRVVKEVLGICCPHHDRKKVAIPIPPASQSWSPAPIRSFCSEKCGLPLSTCTHRCKSPCHMNGDHPPCTFKVSRVCPKCKKGDTVDCGKKDTPCAFPCSMRKKCSHVCPGICSDDCSLVKCKQPCGQRIPDCNHICPDTCHFGSKYHGRCEVVLSNAVCSMCNERGSLKCYVVKSKFSCGQRRNAQMQCGHTRSVKCGESPDSQPCEVCEKRRKDEKKVRRKQVEEELKVLRAKETESKFALEEVPQDDSSFVTVASKVEKYAIAQHGFLLATRVQRVHNMNLRIRYTEMKLNLIGEENEDQMFHGTGKDGIEGITKNGFRLGTKGMFGQGIYFSSISSKSAQELYTKGSGQLLLCRVLKGKEHKARKAMNSLTKAKLVKNYKCDSVYAAGYNPEKKTGCEGLKNDEFIVYDVNQALPEFVVTFQRVGPSHPMLGARISDNAPFRIRTLNAPKGAEKDSDSNHFRIALSQYHMYMGKSAKATKIEIIENGMLSSRYQQFMSSHRPHGTLPKEVYVFHGSKENIYPLIAKEGFKIGGQDGHVATTGSAHGVGVYSSQSPDVAKGYARNGTKMLICCAYPTPDTHLVGKDVPYTMIIFKNKAQIIPMYLVHWG